MKLDVTPGAAPEAPEPATSGAAAGPGQGRRRRTVLWSALGMGVVLAALISVVASAEPSSEVSAPSPLLGNAAPAISGPAISGPGAAGGRYSLAQFRGKWVLVNFMATWCDPCRQEMPQLLLFARQHAKSGDATVLTVVDDASDVGQLKSYLAAEGAGWPAVNDPSATVSYGLAGLPSSFLVTPSGIVYAYLLGDVRASELDRWLVQGAAKGFGQA